jgi:hypothetical protein
VREEFISSADSGGVYGSSDINASTREVQDRIIEIEEQLKETAKQKLRSSLARSKREICRGRTRNRRSEWKQHRLQPGFGWFFGASVEAPPTQDTTVQNAAPVRSDRRGLARQFAGVHVLERRSVSSCEFNAEHAHELFGLICCTPLSQQRSQLPRSATAIISTAHAFGDSNPRTSGCRRKNCTQLARECWLKITY